MNTELETRSQPEVMPDSESSLHANERADSVVEQEVVEQKQAVLRNPWYQSWKIDIALLIGMLVLALVGMAVTQASNAEGWRFWIFAAYVYCGIGIFYDLRSKRRSDTAIWKVIGKQVLHWAGLLIAMKGLILLEYQQAIASELAAIASLFLLALSCYLAGVHFHWQFAIVGVFLAVMAVAVGTIEQYVMVLWLLMGLLAVTGVLVFYVRSKWKTLSHAKMAG